jgi:hypothetical protein
MKLSQMFVPLKNTVRNTPLRKIVMETEETWNCLKADYLLVLLLHRNSRSKKRHIESIQQSHSKQLTHLHLSSQMYLRSNPILKKPKKRPKHNIFT